MKIRPVRTISRKGPVPLTGLIESQMTWVTGSRDSSTVREASTSQSVESATVDLEVFRRVTELVLSGRHLSVSGIEEALKLDPLVSKQLPNHWRIPRDHHERCIDLSR